MIHETHEYATLKRNIKMSELFEIQSIEKIMSTLTKSLDCGRKNVSV